MVCLQSCVHVLLLYFFYIHDFAINLLGSEIEKCHPQIAQLISDLEMYKKLLDQSKAENGQLTKEFERTSSEQAKNRDRTIQHIEWQKQRFYEVNGELIRLKETYENLNSIPAMSEELVKRGSFRDNFL